MVRTIFRAIAGVSVVVGVLGCDPGPPKSAPATKVVPASDVFHGMTVTEDYRWLEDWENPGVRKWAKAQDRYVRGILDRLPNRETIETRVTEILSAEHESYGSVRPAGGKFFAMKRQPPKQQSFLVVFDTLDEAGLAGSRVLVDPNELDTGGGMSIDWFRPSPDGSLVAVSLSSGGSEAGDLHVFETEGGTQVFEVIPRVNTGTAGGDLAWTADGSGVYYTRHPRDGERPTEDLNFFQQAWFHQWGTALDADRYELGKDFPRIAEIEFEAHHATGQVLLTVQNGDGGEFAHYLRSSEGEWRQISEFGDKIIQATFSDLGDFLYVLSRENAPRGKLLRLRASGEGSRVPEVILEESEDTIVNSFYGRPPSILPTMSRLYVQFQVGGPSEIRVFDLHGNPQPKPRQLAVGRAGGLTRLGVNDEIFFTQSSFTEHPALYRFDPDSEVTEKTVIRSKSPIRFDGVTVKREFAESKDGTQVPVNILLPSGYEPGTPAPALVTGYGGYGISIQPGVSDLRSVLLEKGVIVAVANLRGGGEFGEAWHRAGNLTNKQNVFDDFIAVLEHLVAAGYTTSESLAIEGGSNGGLLMGAIVTQRPDLIRSVVSHVGIYDMLRVELSPNGSFNIPEFGSVKNPDQFQALVAYSPYHNVTDGTAYPPMLFLTGINDPRVDAMQSRKMTARLQAATREGAGGPILLRTSLNSGHGRGTALDEQIAQQVDVYSFLFEHWGIEFGESGETAELD